LRDEGARIKLSAPILAGARPMGVVYKRVLAIVPEPFCIYKKWLPFFELDKLNLIAYILLR
jgi:hypothetical protein